jgi:peptidoglycan hydrolase CwlO-like protein
MSDSDEKILKVLESLQTDVTALRTGQQALESGQQALQADVRTQGKRLETLEAGQQTLELKVETIHEYQKKTHGEIMDSLFESNETTGRTQKALEKRIERIEKHLDLPPLK